MKERTPPPIQEKDDGKGYERFEALTRRIVAVPKSEIVERPKRKTRKRGH
jgi:hypothetical protein